VAAAKAMVASGKMFKQTSFSLFLFILLFSLNASALGIAPSRIGYINFEPNLTLERDVYVFNSEHYDFPVEMELGGDLAQYANLSEYNFVLSPKGTEGEGRLLTLNVRLPEKLDEPGEHIIKVGALQAPPTGVPAGALAARVKVGTGLYVFLPYPGKYIDADLAIENARVNESVKFKISITHRGNLTINEISGVVEVYNSEGKKAANLLTNKGPLEPDNSIELETFWNAVDVNPGNYKALAIIDYDGIKKEIEKDFRVGSPNVKIINITSASIVNGTVGKIIAQVRSYWDEPILNVYISISIKRGEYSKTVQSPSVDLDKFSEANLEIYWDTADAAGPGDYPANVTVHYLNETESVPLTITVTERSWFGPGMEMIIVVILVTSAVFIAAVILYRRKGRHKVVQKRLM